MAAPIQCSCGSEVTIPTVIRCDQCGAEHPHPIVALEKQCEEVTQQRNSSTMWMCVATVLVFVLLGLLYFGK